MSAVVIAGWLEFAPGDRDRWLAHAGELMRSLRGEPECHAIEMVADAASSTRVFLYEHYASAEAMKAPAILQHKARFAALTEGCRAQATALDRFAATKIS